MAYMNTPKAFARWVPAMMASGYSLEQALKLWDSDFYEWEIRHFMAMQAAFARE